MRSIPRVNLHDESGIVLAIVVIFVLLLTLSGFSAAFLTRTEIQIVNNSQNEKEAFYLAEAGVAEALVRLGMTSPTMVTAGANTFDAAIAPDQNDPSWTGYILYDGMPPATDGSKFTTPTIQPDSDRLLYSSDVAGTEALTLRWSLDSFGAIRIINGRRILKIVSPGRSGTARRTVTVDVTKSSGISLHVNSSTACPGIRDNGNASIKVAGTIQVNSTCSSAIRMSGAKSQITSQSGTVDVVGGVAAPSGSISPSPTTGAPSRADPLASLQPPCFRGYTGDGTQACTNYWADPLAVEDPRATYDRPRTLSISGNTTLNPGVYYGGINVGSGTLTMQPGLYIMAGGGFTVGSNGSVVSLPGGVTIFNTKAPLSTKNDYQARSISFGSNGTINLSGPASGTYTGIVFFQDRALARTQPAISISGGFKGTLDGILYAINAELRVSGNARLAMDMVIDTIEVSGRATIIPPPNPYSAVGGTGWGTVAWLDY